MRISCEHCHQDGEHGIRILLFPDGKFTATCGRCGSSLFDLDIEVLPQGVLLRSSQLLAAPKEGG